MDKLLSAISLCKRAGKLLMGFDRVKDAIIAHKAVLVLTAADLSGNSRAGIGAVCGAEHIECLVLPVTMEELWYQVGRRTGILAVTDAGLAGLIQKTLRRATENREEPDI